MKGKIYFLENLLLKYKSEVSILYVLLFATLDSFYGSDMECSIQIFF